MITYFYVYMFWYSHTSIIKCIDNHMLLFLHALTRTCPFAYMRWCSYAWTLLWLDAPMLTCFIDHMYLSSHAMMITFFHVYMLWWSHAHLHVWLRAHMLGCFDDYLLLFWNASMTDAYMHWYSHVWYLHTCSHTWIMKCLLARRLKWSCSRMFVRLNALTIVLECWDDWVIRSMCTLVLKCSYECMRSWSHALSITYSHLYLLWW